MQRRRCKLRQILNRQRPPTHSLPTPPQHRPHHPGHEQPNRPWLRHRLVRVRMRWQLIVVEGQGFNSERLPQTDVAQPHSLPITPAQPPPPVRQRKRTYAVSAVGGGEEGEEG